MSLDRKLRQAQNKHDRAQRDPCDDLRAPKSLSVDGPYRNRDKWRLVLIDSTGRRSKVYETREEAEAIKGRLLSQARAKQGKTIGQSLDEYAEYRRKTRGIKALTAEETTRNLRNLLPLDWPIVSLTPQKAERLYLEYTERPSQRDGKPISVATHQWVLLLAKGWSKWCVKSGMLASSPFAAVEPIGKRSAGKLQHTVDEAQRLNAHLLSRIENGDRAAVGILFMLHLGMRKGEVSARVVRDVDADGQILIIPFGKTASARRRVRVPQWLQSVLRWLVIGLAPGDLLFSVEGKTVSHDYWNRKLSEYCDQAGVPKVCPHSLRGLHATLALEEGATSDAVARALGHTSFSMTAKHYASADSVTNARISRAGHLLAPRPTEPQQDEIEAFLARLSPAQRDDLRQRLAA